MRRSTVDRPAGSARRRRAPRTPTGSFAGGSTSVPAVSSPPWSSRNGGYWSVIKPAYAATRSTQRFRPITKSNTPRG